MRNELKALVVGAVILFGCGGLPEESGPVGDVPVDEQASEEVEPTFAKATWTNETACTTGVFSGRWATYTGVSPPALLGTIPAACCPAAKAYAATCNCPHGSATACVVTVKADCTATLEAAHLEYNMTVTLAI
jgi:hypothetical protein